MRRVSLSSAVLLGLAALASGAGSAVGCGSVGNTPRVDPGGGGASTSSSAGGDGGAGAAGGAGGVDSGLGGIGISSAETGAGMPDVVNPCGSECGDEELCDPAHLGLDDDCDGDVDETCGCIAGQAHACFRGDPSYRHSPGCFPGTEICTETGVWGPCVGGRHADERCFDNPDSGCHPMEAAPFADLELKAGTGAFSDDAVPGTEVWTVECPEGVDPCPAVGGSNPKDKFKPLQSGEYKVTYTKGIPGGGTMSCSYPLFVGARGLRVELEWEHDRGVVDLDLHLHKPDNLQPWKMSGSPVDCGYNNCLFDFLTAGQPLGWFSDTATPPDPVSWYLDPVESENTCYFAPHGVGQLWRAYGKGCHNPRLDLDNKDCDPRTTDPNQKSFCAPENINVDFPPRGQWMRIAVHYYSARGVSADIHPRVKVYCDRALGAILGPTGFYIPERPVAFRPEDAGENGSDPNARVWLVADVIFPKPDECGNSSCVVRPLYQDEAERTPLLTTRRFVEATFSPGYRQAP